MDQRIYRDLIEGADITIIMIVIVIIIFGQGHDPPDPPGHTIYILLYP